MTTPEPPGSPELGKHPAERENAQNTGLPAAAVANDGPPVPPAFRRGDERRAVGTDPELCTFCQRYARKAPGRAGPRPQHCEHVWGTDDKGKPVTCARLDDAHDLWLAVYGGTGPLSDLDVGAQARHLADLRTALDALVTALDPVRGDLTQLDERLAGEVISALARAEQAAADAEEARRATTAANNERAEALVAKEQADNDAAEARKNEGEALVDRDEARQAKRIAEDREKEANTRAQAALQTAKETAESLATANKTIVDQAAKIGELTGANSQLSNRVEELTGETQELRGQLDQQRTEFNGALEEKRTEFEARLNEQRTEFETKLQDQQTEFERQREVTERETATQLAGLNGQVAELTGQVARLTADAEQATAAAERNQTAADDLNRLRTRLLTLLATAGPDDDVSVLRAQLMQLVTGEEGVQDHGDGGRGRGE